MITKLFIALLAICLVTCTSGSKEETKTQRSDSLNSNPLDTESFELSDSIKKVIREKDSLYPNYVSEFDILNLTVDSSKTKNATLIWAPCAIIIKPDSMRLKKLEAETSPQDLASLAGDNDFYQAECESFFKKENLTVIKTNARYYKFKLTNGRTVFIDTKLKLGSGWFTILFEANVEPIIADPKNIKQEYEDHFNYQ